MFWSVLEYDGMVERHESIITGSVTFQNNVLKMNMTEAAQQQAILLLHEKLSKKQKGL